MKQTHIIKIYIACFLFLFILTSCTPHQLYRTEGVQTCTGNECSNALIEQHNHLDSPYDLAFIEFTERGNLFNRDYLNTVLEHIKQEEQNKDVLVLVYAHGWKHDANNQTDGEVERFRKLLKILSSTQVTSEKRKVIGVYVGWRGLSNRIEPLRTLSYWGRKNVAHQVGHGGVSEVLLRLQRILKQDKPANKNIYIVSGHSFGAAVMSTAMKDIIIDKIVNAKHVSAEQCNTIKKFQAHCRNGCVKTEPFADGVMLVNPAIEANEFVQIKALVSEQQCYAKQQSKLMYVLSSEADMATRLAFKPGQMLGVSIRNHEIMLERQIASVDLGKKKSIAIHEYDLDTTTIGNYAPFRTGLSGISKDKQSNHYSTNFKKCYADGECISLSEKEDRTNSFPVSPFEPFASIYTNSEFIQDHSDIFNEHVTAYMTAAVIENRFKQDSSSYHDGIARCFKQKNNKQEFAFNRCIKFFLKQYEPAFCKEYKRQDCRH